MPTTLAWPIARNGDGSYKTVEQGTPGEIRQACALVLAVPAGSLIDNPRFGVPRQELRRGGVRPEELRTALGRWEPRASETITAAAITGHSQQVDVRVGPR